ncbi:MAG: winged helix-turn-helix transcriptional regulator [Crenarchaeota archaeon]|nr:winged helix-turn-helix transcriptional regulator [Thermoproteota archaeon]
MPRRQTSKVIERKKQILELLLKEGELPTNEIVRRTGLSHSQVFYALKLLQRDGLVKEIKRGKVAYWRAAENVTPELIQKMSANEGAEEGSQEQEGEE